MEEEKKLDIRWKQRFQNYKKALSCLNSAVKEKYIPLFNALKEKLDGWQ